MKFGFDWNISIGTLIELGVVLLALWRFWMKFRDQFFSLRQTLTDFPPHRHTNGKIIYPAKTRLMGDDIGDDQST